MTFKLTDKYGSRVNGATSKNPRGSFKNRTAPTSADGSYLEQEWANDDRALVDALLLNAGIEPNGVVDDGSNSQAYEALMKIVSSMINASHVPLYGVAGGSENALTVTLPREIELVSGVTISVRASYMNTNIAPTLKVNNLAVVPIVKGANQTLMVGDIDGAGYLCHFVYDGRINRWVLTNPAYGVRQQEVTPVGTIAYFGRSGTIAGWLALDGKQYLRSQYPEFVSNCPNLYTSGSSAEYFKILDCRGYFLRSLDGGRGVDSEPSRKMASIQSDAIRNITGTFPATVEDQYLPSPTGALYFNGKAFEAEGRGHSNANWQLAFDASRVVPTAGENRVKNMAFPLYVKV